MWYQLNRSGFCFRVIDGKCIQAAVLTFLPGEEMPAWSLFNPAKGQLYWDTKKQLFQRPNADWLEVLDTLPYYSDDDHAFLLEIITD